MVCWCAYIICTGCIRYLSPAARFCGLGRPALTAAGPESSRLSGGRHFIFVIRYRMYPGSRLCLCLFLTCGRGIGLSTNKLLTTPPSDADIHAFRPPLLRPSHRPSPWPPLLAASGLLVLPSFLLLPRAPSALRVPSLLLPTVSHPFPSPSADALPDKRSHSLRQ